MLEEDDDGGVDLYGLMQARLGWPVAVSELLGLVAAWCCTPPPVCPQTCCTLPMLQASVFSQCSSLNEKKRKNLFKIDKYQNGNTTSSLCTSASRPISGTKDTHNVFFSKRRFSTNIKVSRKWGLTWSFLSKLSVLLWKSWKMIHQ